MRPIHFLSKSRGTRNLLRRIRTIIARFGITSSKFGRLLTRYTIVSHEMGCVPTFAVTAVVMRRHAKLIRELGKQGAEFAVHGYIHTDYAVLPADEQARHFSRAVNTFQRCRVPFTGFRAPFLRVNNQTPKALGLCNFPYDSSYVIHWDVIDSKQYSEHYWSSYERLINFYQAREAQTHLALPQALNGFVEIPVSIPDDESVVDRLGITSPAQISAVWQAILQMTYERGELFTLQFHPERFLLCEQALVDLLRQAEKFSPPVWVATLKEITTWWKEKEAFTFEISPENDGKYRVHASCSERATLLLQNCRADKPVRDWVNSYQNISARDFILESPRRPVVGVAPDTAPAAIHFIKSEGYTVEQTKKPENYSVYLNGLAQFGETDKKPLAEKLERSGASLLRFWRWPNSAKSALCVTGDIDSITIIDFGLRIIEMWRHSQKQRLHGE